MKAYGLPRHPDIEAPDKADITHYGLKGERRRAKRSTRRMWRKLARLQSKRCIQRGLKL